MTAGMSSDISGDVAAWGEGDQEALNRLMPAIYPELRRIARQHLGRRASGQTLESAALANEAYLRLIRAGGIRCESRAHFLALCAQIIRRIIVDYARRRGKAQLSGYARVTLDEESVAVEAGGIDLLALDGALESLLKFDPRKARVVELRYFAGATIEETAEALSISPETAKRDWKMAKAWLARKLRGARPR
jgi:RNA polymerase sigma-70 factor, ECF subfamily